MKENLGMCETQARRVIKQLLEAVKHLHKNNLVHLDIKVTVNLVFPSTYMSICISK